MCAALLGILTAILVLFGPSAFLGYRQHRIARRLRELDTRLGRIERSLREPVLRSQAAAAEETAKVPAPTAREAPREPEGVPAEGPVQRMEGGQPPLDEQEELAAGAPPDAPEEVLDAAPLPPPPPKIVQEAAPSADTTTPGTAWERWLGIRGFALLGGGVLALAGILLVQDLAARGFFPPVVRVVLGFLGGMAAIAGSEVLRRRSYQPAANPLAGAGLVSLYAASWAAGRHYGLIPFSLAFVLLALITLTGAVLAWRHRSQAIAAIGLAGGFLTPLLLATRLDEPIGLFGYLLLLDAGALVLLRRRRWPWLAIFAFLATALYQVGWIFGSMSAQQAELGLVILGVFAAIFMLSATDRRQGQQTDGLAWRIVQGSALLLPFIMGLYFSGRADLSPHLFPLALLLGLLSAAALWLEASGSLRQGMSASVAAGSLGVVLAWMLSHDLASRGWELTLCTFGLSLVFYLAAEWWGRVAQEDGGRPWLPSLLAIGGFLGILVLANLRTVAAGSPTLWPFLAGWLGLGALWLRQGRLPGLEYRQLGTALGLGTGLATHFMWAGSEPLGAGLFFAIVTLLAILFQVRALTREHPPEWRFAEFSAAIFSLISLFSLVFVGLHSEVEAGLFVGIMGVLGVCVLLVANRLGNGWLHLAAVAALMLPYASWTLFREDSVLTFVGQLGVVALLIWWPYLSAGRLLESRLALYGAAASGPLFFLPLRASYEAVFGDATIGLLPVGLALLYLGAAYRGSSLLAGQEEPRRRCLVWLLAATIGFLALAVPLQLEREWWTIGWALQGAALLALWRRFDHPGLKGFALALLSLVVVRLVMNPAVLDYHPTGGLPIFNWLMYTYLVPAAALVAGFRLLESREVARQRPWEAMLYAKGWPIGAALCGLGAVAVVFVWINLTIIDAFSTGQQLVLSLERLPARDLCLSLAWALYALCLLGIGLRRGAASPRWISLGLLLVTLVKVFLYDLGHLSGLYRVGSLAGLAISLLTVSLIYQRYVFRTAGKEE